MQSGPEVLVVEDSAIAISYDTGSTGVATTIRALAERIVTTSAHRTHKRLQIFDRTGAGSFPISPLTRASRTR